MTWTVKQVVQMHWLEGFEAHLPESYELTYGYFQSRGAYQRFKALLDRKDRLEHWYAFEQTAVEEALRRWSAENDLQLKS